VNKFKLTNTNQVIVTQITCNTKHSRHSHSIIWIHIMKSDSLETCTCSGLYCYTKSLPIGFSVGNILL